MGARASLKIYSRYRTAGAGEGGQRRAHVFISVSRSCLICGGEPVGAEQGADGAEAGTIFPDVHAGRGNGGRRRSGRPGLAVCRAGAAAAHG